MTQVLSLSKMTKPKGTAVKKLDPEGSSAELQSLAQKPKLIPPEALVQKDYDTLVVVLKNGYTYTEIAQVYGRHGIKVTPAQLKVQVEALRAKKEQAEALVTSQPQEPDEQLTTEASSTKAVVKPVKRTAVEEPAQMALTEG